ncbi:hypothetical protein D915_007109 [Fasciola hepatica]|uniref:Uncharacterized protein n=1 Tax=Fasciola hepatica TaxID=6192 RepID=A0A4E0RW34_FASHE|nr:hypothetical protein D915_007109 [Fasciola hepatica]
MAFLFREPNGIEVGERVDWTKERPNKNPYVNPEDEKRIQDDGRDFRTIYREKYQLYPPPAYKNKEVREDDVRLYNRIREEVEKDFEAKNFETDYTSTTHLDFHCNPPPGRPRPEPRLCELAQEQPVTFWTEHLNCLPVITVSLDDFP